MSLHKFSADYLFDGTQFLDGNKVLVFNESGVLQAIIDRADAGDNVRHFSGILMPGLVNCHSHLELSHMKNIIPSYTGLVNFLLSVVKKRAVDNDDIIESIIAAEQEMYENGIVLVADICNTTHALNTKEASKIAWINLIEVINMFDGNLEKQLQYYADILQQYKVLDNKRGSSGLTPHAPYSVSNATHKALNEIAAGGIISIHNQETKAENDLFLSGQGDFLNLYRGLGVEGSPIAATGKTSLQSYLPAYSDPKSVLLVHNTFITEEDILFARAHAAKYDLEIAYCLCPNANLYIENVLPPVELLLKHHCKIVLGTDSYSSNWQLSIAAEIKTLTDHFPQIPLETILKWATANGAAILKQTAAFGHFTKGVAPGLTLLETENQNKRSITGKSKKII